ncbi:MAG: nitrophenyl compound nitroreductase subunit ArsF family protein [Candidatus Pacebacteria bacterium]|nr:nitrophenyl compound nitroreductase subunit ArsF family protein [Candidatus Paceibacterota bacterium]
MKKFIATLIILGVAGVLGILSAIPKKDAANEQSVILDSSIKPQEEDSDMSIAIAPAEKVEVFLFHRTQRCITCTTIGKLAGKTVEERFGPEVLSGKIVFREVNIDEPQNKALAEKFQASGSSLFINATREGGDNIQEDMEVWRLTNNPAAFKNYLENKINALLDKQ